MRPIKAFYSSPLKLIILVVSYWAHCGPPVKKLDHRGAMEVPARGPWLLPTPTGPSHLLRPQIQALVVEFAHQVAPEDVSVDL